MGDEHKPRDLDLLDALDRLPRSAIRQLVWRTVREGRDPLEGGRSHGRWGHEGMETLYTSCEEEGSVAERHALLSLQPVFPSKLQWATYQVQAELDGVALLPTLPELATLGVDVEKYHHRDYARTQEIADAALFLGFSGLVVPSARWDCINLVVFPERIEPGQLTLVGSPGPVDWPKWRERLRARTRTRP
ncbi:MAG TPA: RES family NAD+ phosphorylase [Terriglobales bacterium]